MMHKFTQYRIATNGQNFWQESPIWNTRPSTRLCTSTPACPPPAYCAAWADLPCTAVGLHALQEVQPAQSRTTAGARAAQQPRGPASNVQPPTICASRMAWAAAVAGKPLRQAFDVEL
jgi:hypothetical protein